MAGAITQGAANVFVTEQIFTPIPRLKTVGNRAKVMELLYMDVLLEGEFNKVDEIVEFQMHLGTQQSTILPWNDTRVIMMIARQTAGATNVGFFLGSSNQGLPTRYQFQTMDGFGYLLASDSFRISLDTANLEAQVIATGQWKLFYRFVDIPLAEFIGIVQSTQAT